LVVCDIYMWFLIYCVELWFLIYIYALLFTWKSKKQKKICCGFVECNDHCTRQSWENSSNNFPDLPSAMAIALGKENLKKIKNALPSALAVALGKENFLKNKNRLCRVPRRYGTRQRILKKKEKFFSECCTRQRN